ncbi:hypothetical protein ACOSQ2_030674 [Xanthoceras sorbifolium]
MKHRVIRHSNNRDIVTPHCWSDWLRNPQLMQERFEPSEFSHSGDKAAIFSLRRRSRNYVLLFSTPRNEIRIQKDALIPYLLRHFLKKMMESERNLTREIAENSGMKNSRCFHFYFIN